MRHFQILLLLLGIIWGSPSVRAVTFTNPVIPPNTADIFVRYYQGKYYVVTTHGDLKPLPSDNGLHNAAAIYCAPTLGALATTQAVPVHDVGDFLESPELWLFDGHWYLYYTVPHGKPGEEDENNVQVLESVLDDPMGPYDFKGTLSSGAWDATILKMKGKRYLLSSPGPNLWMQEMASPVQLTGPRVKLSYIDQPWETAGHDARMRLMEAPEALHHGDDYFIFYTVGDYRTNDYFLGALKYQGGDPMAPSSWKKLPGPLFHGNNGKSLGAGDCTPFTAADGSIWFAYGAWNKPGGVRSCRVQKLDFDSDGNPKFPLVIDPGEPLEEPVPKAP
jgi:GH43 family beta-xylosidase